MNKIKIASHLAVTSVISWGVSTVALIFTRGSQTFVNVLVTQNAFPSDCAHALVGSFTDILASSTDAARCWFAWAHLGVACGPSKASLIEERRKGKIKKNTYFRDGNRNDFKNLLFGWKFSRHKNPCMCTNL